MMHVQGHVHDVPCASHVSGLTSLAWQHERAAQRIRDAQMCLTTSCSVALFHGDAICRPFHTDKHPLHPVSSHPRFTSVLALDCAYHFDTRRLFIRQCHHRLSSGGTLALADIFLYPNARSVRITFICKLLGIIPANLWTKDEYILQLHSAGFRDILFMDITPKVFPGFRKFLRSSGWVWAMVEHFVFKPWVDAGGGYALISATKK